MKRYPCVGGPLDGVHVTSRDLERPVYASRDYGATKAGDLMMAGGKHAAHGRDYAAFNRQNAHDRVPTMIWLYIPLLDAGS
jgi:hypothetical protein